MKPQLLKSILQQEINSLDPSKCAKNPLKDFSRSRKLPLNKLISIILRLEGQSMGNELMTLFPKASDMPSVSAFVQQRNKLKPGTFDELFTSFIRTTESLQHQKTLNGLRLFAVDGSDILIPTDSLDEDSFIPESSNQAAHNMLHLNAMYDLLQGTYIDEIIQNYHEMNEHRAFVTMVDRSSLKDVLVMADRGYESFNNMAHVAEKGWYFLIRAKDAKSSGIASGLDLPSSGNFDVAIDLNLTIKQTNAVKELLKDRNHYRYIGHTSTFDYLPSRSRKSDPIKWYSLSFRVVRFQINEENSEVILTNLPYDLYPPEMIKRLYSMRWGIETSFRALKYTVGLLYFHSKKAEYIRHEIVARLIMYNIFALITSHIVINRGERKHDYRVNFSAAVHACRLFIRGDISPPDLEALLSRMIVPIRPDRSRKRGKHTSSVISFSYRLS